jgi:hypothetical protein
MIINRPAEFLKKKTNVRKKVGRTAVMLELWTALCAAITCVSSSSGRHGGRFVGSLTSKPPAHAQPSI